MDDAELEQSLDLDDSFEVKQVLAKSDSGRTELVVSKDENYGLLVRKYIARELARSSPNAKVRRFLNRGEEPVNESSGSEESAA